MPYSYEPHYFEDFAVGQTFETIGRTITETDLVNQAAFSGDWTEYHTNEAYARDTPFGERIGQAPLTISISMGLMTTAGFLTRTVVGLGGMDETRFPNPVEIGETVSATISVTDKRDVDRQGASLVELELVTTTTEETMVLETSLTLFVRKRTDSGQQTDE